MFTAYIDIDPTAFSTGVQQLSEGTDIKLFLMLFAIGKIHVPQQYRLP